ncbi:helix-turn-helix transcriptional regulator [Kribbella deserti]|uniref:LuxR C-terminal-related transcriptional regulator n=1 Tax=Kribbella deserti TaxID=1926257 RepID=A0ABV6QUM3_9ACTN
MTETAALLEAGGTALANGDWVAARTAFGEAVHIDQTAEGHFGLGTAHWWLGNVREAFSYWERAYAGFSRSDPAQAVGVAIGLSLLYEANAGNRTVARAWAARAARLAAGLEEPVLSAWVLLAKCGSEDDPLQVAAWAERAHQVAVRAGDRDLELCALSMRGSAYVDLGRIADGGMLLDEALAGALGGEGANLDTVVLTSCLLMRSCVHGADYLRVIQWNRSLETFIERYGCPYLNATCRASYGAVLVSTGDWARAETELAAAVDLARDALPAVRAEAFAYLADLRLAQGRVEEARQLLAGFEDRAVVLPVLVAGYLATSEISTAVSIARQRLSEVEGRFLEEARLREALGEACLVAGDVDGALREGRYLAELATHSDSALITARAERLTGRALLAAMDLAEACAHLAAARTHFSILEMPLEVARTRMAFAAALVVEEPEPAIVEARMALTVFEDLGAATDADAAAGWLRSAGAAAARVGPKGLGLLTKRELDVLELLADGPSNPEIAARLYLSRRTVEHHVASVLSKLGLRNRAEAAAFATRRRASI